MINFYDRIYLLLTLKDKEFKSQIISSLTLLGIIITYVVVGMLLGLPSFIDYKAVIIGTILIGAFYFYINSSRLDIDWDLLKSVEEARNREPVPDQPDEISAPIEMNEDEIAEDIVEEIPTNNEIEMIDIDDFEFDFGDALESLYNRGTPKQLANAAVNGVESKVTRMLR